MARSDEYDAKVRTDLESVHAFFALPVVTKVLSSESITKRTGRRFC